MRQNGHNGVKKIAVLSSGGDAPGTNACIRAIVRVASERGMHVLGITHGYAGLLNSEISPLTRRAVGNIIQRGGTILGTSRCKEFTTSEGRAKAASILADNKVDGLIVLGGDGSFMGAAVKYVARGKSKQTRICGGLSTLALAPLAAAVSGNISAIRVCRW